MNAKPSDDWTAEEWEAIDMSSAPTFACPNCRRKGVRVHLVSEWEADDDRCWRRLSWECDRCTFAWEMRRDRLAPDWSARVN